MVILDNGCFLPYRHETSNQRRLNVVPQSAMLPEQKNSIGSKSGAQWVFTQCRPNWVFLRRAAITPIVNRVHRMEASTHDVTISPATERTSLIA